MLQPNLWIPQSHMAHGESTSQDLQQSRHNQIHHVKSHWCSPMVHRRKDRELGLHKIVPVHQSHFLLGQLKVNTLISCISLQKDPMPDNCLMIPHLEVLMGLYLVMQPEARQIDLEDLQQFGIYHTMMLEDKLLILQMPLLHGLCFQYGSSNCLLLWDQYGHQFCRYRKNASKICQMFLARPNQY